MQRIINILFKTGRKVYFAVLTFIQQILIYLIFYSSQVKFEKITTIGLPFISIAQGGKCVIGKNFIIISSYRGNPIGRNKKSVIFVDSKAKLIIGNHVGISGTALICYDKISIGNYVKLGGGVCIYDTDFHSLDPKLRRNPVDDRKSMVTKPVLIRDNVFIGAHSTILKGITIGENAIIGAGSVVTKNIPANEIWAGNPAKFIKKLDIK